MNALRWWLSWDAFHPRPQALRRATSSTALRIAGKLGLAVMPVLFNRWHDATLDYGGIYIDHFLPRRAGCRSRGCSTRYLEAIVGGHADDPRILAWDLCNEPFSYGCRARRCCRRSSRRRRRGSKGCTTRARSSARKAPITVGIHPGVPLELVEPISDMLSIHPYWVAQQPKTPARQAYEKKLDALRGVRPEGRASRCWPPRAAGARSTTRCAWRSSATRWSN